jgi:hypothetical protein
VLIGLSFGFAEILIRKLLRALVVQFRWVMGMKVVIGIEKINYYC